MTGPDVTRKVVPFRLNADEAAIIAIAVEMIERNGGTAYYGPRCTVSSFVRHAAIRLAEQVTGKLALSYQGGTLFGDRIEAVIQRTAAGPSSKRAKRSAADRTVDMFPELAKKAPRRKIVAPVAKPADVTGWAAAAARCLGKRADLVARGRALRKLEGERAARPGVRRARARK